MKIILLQRVEHLGQMGDVVTVKPGYARNFLLPTKKAMRATAQNVSFFDKQKAQLEATNLKLRSEAESVAKTMENVQIVVIRQASEVGHLYGSVRSQDVSETLTADGYTINRSQVQIISPIKNLGIHNVRVILHPEVSILVSVIVAQSEEEATVRRQAAAETTTAAAA
jgi:large subunit ribosomal protein L9